MGGMAAATWLGSPFATSFTHDLTYYQGSEALAEPTAKALKWSQRLHPELNVLVAKIRNKVIAHKEQYLMEKYGYSHIGTIIGANHVQIEDDIQQSPEARLAYLRRYKPLIKNTVVPETFYSIVTNTYNEGGWKSKLDVVPELRALVE
jgi:hypothetical protein